jgi:hypothetical protein
MKVNNFKDLKDFLLTLTEEQLSQKIKCTDPKGYATLIEAINITNKHKIATDEEEESGDFLWNGDVDRRFNRKDIFLCCCLD